VAAARPVGRRQWTVGRGEAVPRRGGGVDRETPLRPTRTRPGRPRRRDLAHPGHLPHGLRPGRRGRLVAPHAPPRIPRRRPAQGQLVPHGPPQTMGPTPRPPCARRRRPITRNGTPTCGKRRKGDPRSGSASRLLQKPTRVAFGSCSHSVAVASSRRFWNYRNFRRRLEATATISLHKTRFCKSLLPLPHGPNKNARPPTYRRAGGATRTEQREKPRVSGRQFHLGLSVLGGTIGGGRWAGRPR